MIKRHLICFATILAAAWGCSPAPKQARPWHDFVDDLVDVNRISLLNTPGSRIITSYDRTGGNDDFNNFEGPGSEYGWVTIADIKGPGCVRRFWTTGMDFGHPFKIYFDGEKKPRISGKVEDIFGGGFPFTPPLARYLNLCWVSYVPLTFNKAIRIETKAPPIHPFWGQRRLFYQINVDQFAKSEHVETFPASPDATSEEEVRRVLATWKDAVEWPTPAGIATDPLKISAGQTGVLFSATSPGTLREWGARIAPEDTNGWSMVEREQLAQDVFLRVTYDSADAPSIETPLGDFFCNGWRSRYFGSLIQGNNSNGFSSRFPMPYRNGVRVELINGADRAISAVWSGETDDAPGPDHGYLHAMWQRSGPTPGPPHVFADWSGRGKLVGTFLGVTGQGNDWWILEGDETMTVDGASKPAWHGTGLEDYFNGGWYYRGSAFAALHGIMDRAPFRVAQYRFHLVDSVSFSNSLHMEIERGDQNISPGYFRSVSFAYLDRPTPVPSCAGDRAARRDIDHPYYRQTFMLSLTELERMNNFEKARDAVLEYLERFPDAEERGVLALRALEYRRLLGESIPLTDYDAYARGDFGPAAAEQAKLLQWFYENPRRALVGLNANGKAQLFVDGQTLLTGDHPFNLFVAGVELDDGPHVLAASVEMTRQEPWLLMGVRTHGGLAGSDLDTMFSRQVAAGWNRPGADLKSWQRVVPMDILRGTPDAPMIGGIPNAFVLLPSKAHSLRAQDWGYYKGISYFRLDFSQPVNGWPATSTGITGLGK